MAVLLVTAGSLAVYLVEREAGQTQLVMGDTTTPSASQRERARLLDAVRTG
ncbi:hypothetical protein [Amycolatopsis sp. NPDC051061]|uniref:hypothetical protein n=1 Tax=Amycolatopsis sp. NPDC051061 TaxID=3155042 RepID=UPI003412BE05